MCLHNRKSLPRVTMENVAEGNVKSRAWKDGSLSGARRRGKPNNEIPKVRFSLLNHFSCKTSQRLTSSGKKLAGP